MEDYGFISETKKGSKDYTVKIADIILYDPDKKKFRLSNGKWISLNLEGMVVRKGSDYDKLFREN